MSWISLGKDSYWPPIPPIGINPSVSSVVIDATGEFVAWMGPVDIPGGGSKSLDKVGFDFGTVTKAGGSALTVTHEGVDLSLGPPQQPDGSVGGSVAIANADAGFVTNGWYETASFSASRAVSQNDLLAIRVAFDGAGRLGSDAVNFRNLNRSQTYHERLRSACSLFTGGVWTPQAVMPNIVLIFTDGTRGTIAGSYPTKEINSTAFNSGTNPNQRGAIWVPDFPCKIDGIYVMMQAASGADFTLDLYKDTTLLQSIAVDSNAIYAAAATRIAEGFFPEFEVEVGANYYITLTPTTANNVTKVAVRPDSTANYALWPGKGNFRSSFRNGGAWTVDSTVERLIAGVRLSSLPANLPASRLQLGM